VSKATLKPSEILAANTYQAKRDKRGSSVGPTKAGNAAGRPTSVWHFYTNATGAAGHHAAAGDH